MTEDGALLVVLDHHRIARRRRPPRYGRQQALALDAVVGLNAGAIENGRSDVEGAA